jgi:hypothetical protein
MNPAEQQQPAQAQPQSLVDQAVNQPAASAQQPQQQTPPAQAAQTQQAPANTPPAGQPKLSAAAMDTINAIADYFRVKAAEETPGFIVSTNRLTQVIYKRYGKYPETKHGADKCKAEIKLNDIIVPDSQAA